ncbi:hypothetical protein [Kroppenstedtia eburnea]|uniref:Uncharacterized protein n=1 Tax=Kroppenstedtia eburnea TaxID=714067 RepID=A0A1N7Q251_9BACL|nr:hypothetical protein [Kroppenstedtia eburnea]EGK12827.1 hypothetical protein HMPREF9374_1263 [Desmospora sp. 8437]QKI82651.1 hypothetical protein GXN75_11990 [Kroppenstedtia eburnea]SIT16891.1 hypothetical protein SAMN05421790_1177 [Kroppenstedtia eburnea]
MKGMILLGITLILLLIGRYEWWMINQGRRKEKAVLFILVALGWVLAVLLLYFPDLPGPTRLLEKILSPLVRWMEGEG